MNWLRQFLLSLFCFSASLFPIFGIMNFFSFLVFYWTNYLKFIKNSNTTQHRVATDQGAQYRRGEAHGPNINTTI